MPTNKKNFAPFESVREFFESWGMYPDSETVPDDLNEEVIGLGINRKCYEKLLKDADGSINSTSYPHYFSQFCKNVIDSHDDAFYLDHEYWTNLSLEWEEYIESLIVKG